MNKIDVLDHGYVRLASYTQPVPADVSQANRMDPPRWTGDLEIVRNARTSYNADWRGNGPQEGDGINKDAKLIHYLWKNRHTTPFEAMVFTFEVQAPIFVFRQWHRHRTWSYNEVSARYTELPDLFYVPEVKVVGIQSALNKQARDRTAHSSWAEANANMIRETSELAHTRYKQLLAQQCPREIARLVLPLNTYSRMFATVDLRNLFHFLELRLDAHAQYEIRVYAEALLNLVQPICPIAVDAFKANLKA